MFRNRLTSQAIIHIGASSYDRSSRSASASCSMLCLSGGGIMCIFSTWIHEKYCA